MNSVGLLRKIMILMITLIVLVVFLLIFQFTDVAFRVWDRLQNTPTSFLILYGVVVCLIALLGVFLIYKIWTLGRYGAGQAQTPKQAQPLTLEEVKSRAQAAQSQGVNTAEIERELEQLESDEEVQSLQVAFFGKISTGKSSLIQTLLPDARIETSIIGGSTTRIERYYYDTEQGLNLTLLDMPGTHQAQALDSSSEEILNATRRVHIVVYVLDKDITASDEQAIKQLDGFGKPLIVALNKANLYNGEELALLQSRIESIIPEEATLVTTVSAYPERVKIVNADGHIAWEERLQSGDVGDLLQAFATYGGNKGELADKQKSALLSLMDESLSLRLSTYRRERGEAIVKAYARKAMLGGVAAVGPGTDVLIQGYLGVDMVKALTKLYQVPVKGVDLEALVEAASSKVRTHMTVILALAGNVFKAFPGVGTVLGGASHAIAYGLIFESLGKAMIQTLENTNAESISTDHVLEQFEEQLQYDLENRAENLVKIALAGRKII